jgi:hypothetical protein
LLDQAPFATLTLKNNPSEDYRGPDFHWPTESCQDAVGSLSSGSLSFKPLPKHLTLQLDNSPKDNKNQTMLAFGSDLVARGVFETVTFFFLMVGHTHEDIDASFSKVATQTRNKDIKTLPQLMAECWKCMVNLHMVPWLITEVAAYKDYLLKHEVIKIKGQSMPMAFQFSMRNNVPIYQYKQNTNDAW